jgi:hypothetical protein
MGNEIDKAAAESRFDLQQMLAEIEHEDRQHSNRKVQQSDIQDLFKNRKKRDDNG